MRVNEQNLVLKARKKLKLAQIKVGDFVEIDEQNLVIEKLIPRKNQLIRPPVANVEQALIVIAPVPKPDLLLVDKLLIKFFSLNIQPVIVINKIDLCAIALITEINEQYSKICPVVLVSALDNSSVHSNLYPLLSGKFSIMTGQSAVGKTSLLKVLLPDVNMEVGDLSKKTARGKNTTRHSEIFVLPNGGLLADTPGFNAFELDDFTPEQIVDNTPELKNYSQNCKYNDCNHIGEDISVCAVKQALKNGEFSDLRYQRYCELFKIAKQKEDKKYE